MKLVDQNGRFQFIKNAQVVLDSTLPKYNRIKKIEYEGDEPSPYIDSSDVESSEMLINSKKDSVDKTIRDTILNISSNELKKYLFSDDAKEFNEKFKPILEAEKSENSNSVNIPNSRWYNNTYNTYITSLDDVFDPVAGDKKENIFKRIYKAIKSTIQENNIEKEKEKAAMHVIDFFDIIHVETGKEKEFINKLEGYFNLVRNAALMHQDAQLDELCQNIILHIYESVLSVHGYNKYVTFKDIELMKCDGKKVVDIDYIKNFGRVIPSNIVDQKIFCDNLGVFDNYCIMYYDPSGETYKITSEAKRDPILFGLINHSEKLYYIGDWIDELCDLTLDKVAELCTINELK